MYHSKFNYVKKVVEADMAILLIGEAGCGKSTLAKQISEELQLNFYGMSLTKQSTVNSLLGFVSINGNYIGTQFRKAFEEGGLFLLDEINAADPNVLLCLNTIENGYISFPDGIVNKHKDFRLIATANPNDSIYTGRSKLDFATIDRFYQITLERDNALEENLTSVEVVEQISTARKFYKDHGISRKISMRDAIRLHKLIPLGLSKSPLLDLLFSSEDTEPLIESFKKVYKETKDKAKEERAEAKEQERKVSLTQEHCKSIDDLLDVLNQKED